MKIGGVFRIRHYRDGRLIGRSKFHNIVTNEGLNYVTSVAVMAGAQQASWFIGLIDDPAAGIVAADTLASHSWVEATEYDEITRRPWTLTTGITAGSADNFDDSAVFTISATVILKGAFIASVNTGTAGVLLAAGQMPVVRNLVDNDVLEVDYGWTCEDDPD